MTRLNADYQCVCVCVWENKFNWLHTDDEGFYSVRFFIVYCSAKDKSDQSSVSALVTCHETDTIVGRSVTLRRRHNDWSPIGVNSHTQDEAEVGRIFSNEKVSLCHFTGPLVRDLDSCNVVLFSYYSTFRRHQTLIPWRIRRWCVCVPERENDTEVTLVSG